LQRLLVKMQFTEVIVMRMQQLKVISSFLD
jgi:hypothetical protein